MKIKRIHTNNATVSFIASFNTLLLLFFLAAPAVADQLTWELFAPFSSSGGNYRGSGSANGWFRYDTTTGNMTASDILVTGFAAPNYPPIYTYVFSTDNTVFRQQVIFGRDNGIYSYNLAYITFMDYIETTYITLCLVTAPNVVDPLSTTWEDCPWPFWGGFDYYALSGAAVDDPPQTGGSIYHSPDFNPYVVFGGGIRLTNTSTVPEPGTLIFLSTGLMGLVGLRRKLKI